MHKYRILAVAALAILFFMVGMATRISTDAGVERAGLENIVPVEDARVAAAGGVTLDLRPAETLYSVLRSLKEHYVEPITNQDEGKMTRRALKAMLASLEDPNSRFLEPDERKVVSDAQRGTYHGIGAVLAIKTVKTGSVGEEHLIVETPVFSGPAAEAGIRSGDDIIEVNGRSVLPYNPFKRAQKMVDKARKDRTDRAKFRKLIKDEQNRIDKGISITEADSLLCSVDEGSIDLTIQRLGVAKPIKVTLKPKMFTVDTVAASVTQDGRYSVIRVNCFTQETGTKFADAITEAIAKNTLGLVLDLRGLAGGEGNTLCQMAGCFAPQQLVTVLNKSHDRRSTLMSGDAPKGQTFTKPVVVLVDAGTARIPEVLASFLRDKVGAKLIGARTFGDAAFVTLVNLADGSGYVLTTGELTAAKGAPFAGSGVSVDVSPAIGVNVFAKAIDVLNTTKGNN